METSSTNIFYAGIACDTCAKDNRKLIKEGLPVYRLGRELPYLWGTGRGKLEKLVIYYALLPEHRGRGRISRKFKSWSPEMVWKLLEKTWDKAARNLNCQEQILAYEMNRNLNQVPEKLMAACLYRQRPFDRLCISLPEEGMICDIQQVIELLNPYLPRMRQVIYKGDENEESEILEDFLYMEFGIVMTRTFAVPPGMLWLDLGAGAEKPSGTGRIPDELRYINRLEALKFLDTAVKNGYNTKVN